MGGRRPASSTASTTASTGSAFVLLAIACGGATALRLRHARSSDLRPIAELLADRRATAATGAFDWAAQAEVERWCLALPARLAPRSNHLFAVVADDLGAIVGVTELGMRTMPAGLYAESRVAYIGNVAVGTSQRRSGVGKRLVGFACKWARSQWDCAEVFTHAAEDNAAARGLYEALGFRACEDAAGPPGAASRQVLLVRRSGAQPAPT
jgi:ribosomal protein S18 acetylase RimI-like enzyme